jgi:hypothetical protein
VAQGQEVLKPEEMKKLVPEKIKGYNAESESKSSLIKMGDLRYSLCERKFYKGRQKVKILLFDYKEAPIMYNQAMRRWTTPNVVTDSLVFRNITKNNYTGWETYNRVSSTTQIFIGIKDRYFLMISGENIELGMLQEVLQDFSFEGYPN